MELQKKVVVPGRVIKIKPPTTVTPTVVIKHFKRPESVTNKATFGNRKQSIIDSKTIEAITNNAHIGFQLSSPIVPADFAPQIKKTKDESAGYPAIDSFNPVSPLLSTD